MGLEEDFLAAAKSATDDIPDNISNGAYYSASQHNYYICGNTLPSQLFWECFC